MGEWHRLSIPRHFWRSLTGRFAAWAVPYLRRRRRNKPREVWEAAGDRSLHGERVQRWQLPTNIPRALADQLPWVLLAPLLFAALRRKVAPTFGRPAGERGEAKSEDGGASHLSLLAPPPTEIHLALRGTAWAVAVAFFAVLLIPGTLPRYVLPLGAPIALLLAWAIEAAPLGDRGLARWHRANAWLAALLMALALLAPIAAGVPVDALDAGAALRSFDFGAAFRAGLVSAVVLAICAVFLARRALATPPLLAGASAALMGAGTLLYAAAAIPWINSRDDLRPLARAIDSAVPAGKPLFLYDPGYMAAIFYLRTPVRYAPTTEAIPPDAEWLLARAKERDRLAEKRPEFIVAQALKGKLGEEFLLLQRHGEVQKLPAR